MHLVVNQSDGRRDDFRGDSVRFGISIGSEYSLDDVAYPEGTLVVFKDDNICAVYAPGNWFNILVSED